MRNDERRRVVVCSGAAGGIGRATLRRFAAAGYHVAGWDLLDQSRPEMARDVESCGAEFLFHCLDVSNEDQVEKAVDDILHAWGRIDVLINNAGIIRDAKLVGAVDRQKPARSGNDTTTTPTFAAEMSCRDFDRVLDVNLKAVFIATRTVAPHMLERKTGAIINTASIVGLYGNFGQSNYAAAKAGVIGMTRSWARELGPSGIRVNAVAPGFIETDMTRSVPPKILERAARTTPLRRLGTPSEVAETYFWLASDSASFVHGATICVDGGLVLGT